MTTLQQLGRALALCACMLACAAAPADLITFSFSGVVDAAFATITLPGGPISDGDPISGLLSFDSLAPDQMPADPSTGVYALSDFQLTIGSNTFTLSASPPPPTLTIENDVAGSDSMTVLAVVTDGLRDIDASLQYSDPTASVFTSDALPLTTPAFLPGTLTLEFFSIEGELFVEGTVSRPTVIPSPTAGALGVIGLVSLASLRRRIG